MAFTTAHLNYLNRCDVQISAAGFYSNEDEESRSDIRSTDFLIPRHPNELLIPEVPDSPSYYLGIIRGTMRRPVSVSRASPVCQICELIFARRLRPANAKPIAVAIPRTHTSSQQHNVLAAGGFRDRRLMVTAAAPIRLATGQNTTRTISSISEDASESRYSTEQDVDSASQELSSLTNMITYLENSKLKVLNHPRIPSEADVSAALQACRIVADYIMDESIQPQITHMITEMDSTASNLLSLDKTRPSSNQQARGSSAPDPATERIAAQFQAFVNKISNTAYAILAHPPVFITPSLLQQYVEVQARLGKPETLPRAFQLYASKPMPREAPGGGGSGAAAIEYAEQNPRKLANAIEPAVIEKALGTAIEARNLDAAVGVIEAGYAAAAFLRAKLVRHAVLPASAAAAAPLAAWALATNLAALQDSMDPAAATNVAFVGILAYVGITGSLGILALTTTNDQMRRVTWAPGMPLSRRWLREEERAALDRVACAWGFQEKWRQGEEDGREWNALRDYITSKGMILDRTELMPGMQ
ncbi:hypothetical protein SLS62_000273 [Diatrype stigma]|uniref:Uncharacterized protein n=1 Tax=Diatrype stigma TaxID=117547 RepID=A0AAN9YXY4_9PEZI